MALFNYSNRAHTDNYIIEMCIYILFQHLMIYLFDKLEHVGYYKSEIS